MTKLQRDNLVIKHMDNVGRIAYDIARKLPVSVDVEDLTQAGMIGLLNAADRYEAARGLKFWTFASHHVRGAILDHLRAIDGAARSTRLVQKRADAFYSEHYRKFGTAPTDSEMAEALKMTVERWAKWKVRLLYSSEISMEPKKVSADDEVPREFADKSPLQDEGAGREQIREHIHAALAQLEPKEREVLTEYFFSQKTLLQTGEALGIVESRASQIKKASLLKMRELLDAAGIRRETI
jgi:RNA polymerase sigma factor for flagellar operon FliA